jgi:hypothetical protein
MAGSANSSGSPPHKFLRHPRTHCPRGEPNSECVITEIRSRIIPRSISTISSVGVCLLQTVHCFESIIQPSTLGATLDCRLARLIEPSSWTWSFPARFRDSCRVARRQRTATIILRSRRPLRGCAEVHELARVTELHVNYSRNRWNPGPQWTLTLA